MLSPPQTLRVLHLPTVVGGNAGHLSRGERALGVESDVLTIGVDNPFGYHEGHSLQLSKSSSPISKLHVLGKGFLKIRNQYDVFHFNYGTTLLHSPRFGLNLLDLPFYPRRSRIFVTYNGCDARQKYPTMAIRKWAACHDSTCYDGQCNSGQLDRQRKAGIEKMMQHAHHIWAVNPDLLNFLPPEKSSFLPYSISIGDRSPIFPECNEKLKIAHAPTDRAAKGTKYVIAAFKALIDRYPDQCELDLIENLPREQALDRLARCDVMVDQLLIGWYGGVAVEAMMLGKVVIARIEKDDLVHIPERMRYQLESSILQCDPDQLFATLERCLLDRQRLKVIAKNGLNFARQWHDPVSVAQLTTTAYRAAFDN